MGTADNGLTLEGLAQRLDEQGRENAERLETLERENERMRSENAALRSKVDTLEGSNTGLDKQTAAAFEGEVSRRSLLTKAGAAAVAAVAAGTLLYPREAEASHYSAGISVNDVFTHHVLAEAGFVGQRAVEAFNTASQEGAVHGRNSGSGPGVHGNSADGTGVLGQGKIGILGQSGTTDHGAVYGQHTGTDGYGVLGDGKGTGAGVLGRNSSSGTGIGVKGQGNLIGLKGESTNGYGGHFQGARAQVKLLPNPNVGRPTTGGHQQGELFLDSAAKLFICTVSGTPGTWRKVATTVA